MNLVARVKNLLTRPREEFAVIDREPLSVPDLLTGYVLPLAAIGPIATAIGWSVFGTGGFVRVSVGYAVSYAIAMFILSIVGVFVAAWVINMLAPSFGATPNRHQAIKVSAYSSTAAWVGGIFGIIPFLAPVGVLAGLYSLYLLYVGLPMLMKASPDKAISYTVVVILTTVLTYIVAGYIARAVAF